MSAQRGDTRMFGAIRSITLKPGATEEYVRRVTAGAIPIMREMDGFKAFYVVAGAGGKLTSLSLFTNKTAAETSTRTLMPWIKENLAPLLTSMPEAVDGEVVISEVQ